MSVIDGDRFEIHNGKRYDIVNENNVEYIELNGLKYPAGMTNWQVKFHEEYKPVLTDIAIGASSTVSVGIGSVLTYMGLENIINNPPANITDFQLTGIGLMAICGGLYMLKHIGKLYRK